MGIPHAWWSRRESTITDIKGECFTNFTLHNIKSDYNHKRIPLNKIHFNLNIEFKSRSIIKKHWTLCIICIISSYLHRITSLQTKITMGRTRKAFSRNSHTSFTVSLSIFASVDRCLFSEAFVLFFKAKSAKCLCLSRTYRRFFFSELRHWNVSTYGGSVTPYIILWHLINISMENGSLFKCQ